MEIFGIPIQAFLGQLLMESLPGTPAAKGLQAVAARLIA